MRNRRRANRPRLESLESLRLLSFSPGVTYPVGSSPLSVVAADFNGDTLLDLATANPAADSVSVLIGRGDGSFEAARDSAAGSVPTSLVTGDFDEDGALDLVATQGNGLSVLIGRGDGSFEPPASIAVEPGLVLDSFAVGDFNADGTLDLGVTSNLYVFDGCGYFGCYFHYEGHASVLLGNGDGSFEAPRVSVNFGSYRSAVAADLNGDGRDDFATIEQQSLTAVVFPSNADGSLGTPAPFFIGGSSLSALAAGDVSGDGKPDLVAVGANTNSATVLTSNGLGGFGAPTSYTTGGASGALVLGDFNGAGGDGHLDIATANFTGTGLSVLLNRGDGSFESPLLSAPNGPSFAPAAGDFNRDGRLDLATAGPAGAAVFLNDNRWPASGAPSIAVRDATVVERNTTNAVASFTVRLSAPSRQRVTVQVTTADGTATAGSDYLPVARTLIFKPGRTAITVELKVRGDRLAEFSETFAVRLSESTNAFIEDGVATGTIIDNEPELSLAGYITANEGDVGTTALDFTVTLSSAYDVPVTVGYATEDLTAEEQYEYGPGATAGVDYVPTIGTLTFAPGETTRTISIPVIGDRVGGEYGELFWLRLRDFPPTARVISTQALGQIIDDEPFLSIDQPSLVEPGTGEAALTYTLTLSAPSDAPVTIDFATADGTASAADGDYVPTSGTLTFEPGETVRTVEVQINGDRIGEYDESILLNIRNVIGAGFHNSPAYGQIIDDEPRFIISNPEPINEGNTGTRILNFTVALGAAYDQVVTVDYATTDGNAIAGEDYDATSGTLTFAPGETTKTVSVTVRGDRRPEDEEYFAIELFNASANALAFESLAYGTIIDDEPIVVLYDPNPIREGNSGTRSLTFTIELFAAYDQPVVVDYATVDGDAVAGEDYVATTGRVTFAAGQTIRTFTVPILGDTIREDDEYFFVEIIALSPNARYFYSYAEAEILDND